jgi:hypothetical protein
MNLGEHRVRAARERAGMQGGSEACLALSRMIEQTPEVTLGLAPPSPSVRWLQAVGDPGAQAVEDLVVGHTRGAAVSFRQSALDVLDLPVMQL